MIPKIIHYCWFGPKEMPTDQKRYVEGWKRLMPDYKFKCWTEKDINITDIPFTKEAYEAGKYAYVADYTRIYALCNEGGIYMDTDILLKTRFDDFLKYGVFTSYEYTPSRKQIPQVKAMLNEDGTRKEPGVLKRIPGTGLFSALIGSEPGHPFIHDCLDYYNNRGFNGVYSMGLTVPNILAFHAEKYGLRYLNKDQKLRDNIMIFNNKVFASCLVADSKSLAIHYCAASWVDQSFLKRLKNRLYKIGAIRRMINLIWPK